MKEESINIDSFAKQVFKTPKLVSEFKQYKETHQKERDIEIDDTFETVSNAIKRRATGTMTTIKFDKNFDINIHGGEQYIYILKEDMMKSEVCIIINSSLEKKNKLIIKYLS